MSIKRVFEIYDKNYNEKFEVFSSCGYFKHNSFVAIDIDEVAQNCIENVAENLNENKYKVNKELLEENIKSLMEDIKIELINEIINSATSNIKDDEEIIMEGEENA